MPQTMTTEPAATHPPAGRQWPSAFAALRYRNYRLWFVGQAISLMGTWMQNVAQGWLVYEMTGSEFALGAITFAGSFPTLFLMLPAGAVADHFPRRRLMLITQTVMMFCALVLAALAGTGILRVWHVGLLALVLGTANSFDAPARQSLAVEMVEDRHDLMNAIAMNSLMFNLARVAGPAVGGVLLAAVGPTLCFAFNGLSFLAVLAALLMMRLPPIAQRPRTEPLAAQVAAGLRYIWHSKPIRTIIMLVGISSLFGLSYATLMPVFAADVLHVGEAGLGWLSTAVGVGALVGSLTLVSSGRLRRKGLLLTMGSLLFPGALLVFACSGSLPLSLACLAVVGFGWVTQNATSNTLVQALVTDELRGRVMGAYTLMFFGTSPFGSLMAGSLAQALGPTLAVLISAGITLAFSLGLLLTVPVLRRLEA
jgi:MFS family permease